MPIMPMIGNELGTTRFLSACLQTVLLLMSVFHTGISSVKADVRCYCNLPVCVTSGYMCKSSVGTCVSDHFGFSGDIWRSRHACLELVSGAGREMAPLKCAKRIDRRNLPARLCCKEDMCNYLRSAVDVQNNVYKLNHSYITGFLSNDDYFVRHRGNHHHHTPSMQHHQLWFKAAVIAVPIGGGFVLIILIVMAARMLKADRKRQKQWSELRRRRLLLHNTHLVYTEAGVKSPSGAGLLYLPKSVSSVLLGKGVHAPGLHKGYASAGCLAQQNSLYKNVSIALSTDTACTDSSQDKYFVFDL